MAKKVTDLKNRILSGEVFSIREDSQFLYYYQADEKRNERLICSLSLLRGKYFQTKFEAHVSLLSNYRLSVWSYLLAKEVTASYYLKELHFTGKKVEDYH